VDLVFTCIWAPDILENNPNINRIYDMHALCTDPDYRGRGIAKNLIQVAWKVKMDSFIDINPPII